MILLKLKYKVIDLIFDKFYIFLIFIYLILLLGIYIKYLFNLPNFNFGFIVILIIPGIYNWLIYFFENRDFKNIENNSCLSENKKKIMQANIDKKYMESILIRHIRLALIFFTAFFSGYLICNFNEITLNKLIFKILFGFSISIYLGYTFLYESNDRKRAHNFFHARILLPIFGIIPVLFNLFFDQIMSFFKQFSHYDYFMFALTLVLLCATLAVLSFTYAMALKNKDESIKDFMMKSGEYFFISTIFCIFCLSCLFVLSISGDFFNPNNNINILNGYNFLLINFFVVIILSFFVSFIYSMKYLMKGIILSLKNLPFEFDLF